MNFFKLFNLSLLAAFFLKFIKAALVGVIILILLIASVFRNQRDASEDYIQSQGGNLKELNEIILTNRKINGEIDNNLRDGLDFPERIDHPLLGIHFGDTMLSLRSRYRIRELETGENYSLSRVEYENRWIHSPTVNLWAELFGGLSRYAPENREILPVDLINVPETAGRKSPMAETMRNSLGYHSDRSPYQLRGKPLEAAQLFSEVHYLFAKNDIIIDDYLVNGRLIFGGDVSLETRVEFLKRFLGNYGSTPQFDEGNFNRPFLIEHEGRHFIVTILTGSVYNANQGTYTYHYNRNRSRNFFGLSISDHSKLLSIFKNYNVYWKNKLNEAAAKDSRAIDELGF